FEKTAYPYLSLSFSAIGPPNQNYVTLRINCIGTSCVIVKRNTSQELINHAPAKSDKKTFFPSFRRYRRLEHKQPKT
ncbi:MAG: hypothetical protein WA824_10620, partial [Candidatus Sulfotelmatobacter sp.]